MCPPTHVLELPDHPLELLPRKEPRVRVFPGPAILHRGVLVELDAAWPPVPVPTDKVGQEAGDRVVAPAYTDGSLQEVEVPVPVHLDLEIPVVVLAPVA